MLVLCHAAAQTSMRQLRCFVKRDMHAKFGVLKTCDKLRWVRRQHSWIWNP